MNKRTLVGAMGTMFPKRGVEIRILMYHRVNPDKNLPDPHISVTPENFKKQMAWLKQHDWSVISIQNAINQLKQEEIRSSKQIVITFDDGFKDNYDHAFPILARYNYPAIIYLTEGRLGKDPDFLTLPQIQMMQHCGISFGSHTINHHNLTELSEKQAWEEILQSKQRLEFHLKSPIYHFAYPSGRFHALHRTLIMLSGYRSAVTISPGGNDGSEDLFVLKRTEIAHHDSLLDFQNKLKGGFDLPHRFQQKKQGLYPAPQPFC